MKIQGEHTFASSRELVWRALLDPAVLARVLPGTERLERVGENEFRGVMNVQVGPVKGQFQGTLQLSDLVPLTGYHLKLDGSGAAGFMHGEGELRLADAAAGGTLLSYDLDAQVGGRMAGVGQRLLESSARSIARQGLEGLGRELQALERTAGAAAIPATGTATSAGAGAEPGPAGATVPASEAGAAGVDPPTPPASPTAAAQTRGSGATGAAGTTTAAMPIAAGVAAGSAGAASTSSPGRASAVPPVSQPTQAEMAARVARDVAGDLLPPPRKALALGAALLALVLLVVFALRGCGG